METTQQPEAEVIEATPVAAAAAIVPVPKANALVRPGVGVLFQSVAEVWNVAKNLKDGGAGPPKSSTASIFASILKGQSLGLDPVTSMSFITIVNGRASLMGDLALGLVRKSGLINPKQGGYLREEWSGDGESRTCTLSAKRHDTGEEMVRSFSVAQARAAGLIEKTAVWFGFLDRMLRYRALGFLLRDLFSDILLGLYLTEELQGADYFGPTGTTPPPAPIEPATPAPDPLFSEAAVEIPADAVKLLPEPAAPTDLEAQLRASLKPTAVVTVEDADGNASGPSFVAGKAEDVLKGAAEAVLGIVLPDDPFAGLRDPVESTEKAPTSPSPATDKKRTKLRVVPRRPAAQAASSTVKVGEGTPGNLW